MSYEILTGPDRGPPAYDWRRKADDLERQLARYKRLEALLIERADASQEPGDEGAWTMNAEMRVLTDWEAGAGQ